MPARSRFEGQEIAGLAAHRIARLGVARTFQLVRVLDTMTCRENVIAGLAFRARAWGGAAADARPTPARPRRACRARRRWPAAKLTYIDQKRLELARALALEPRPAAARRMARGPQPDRTARSASRWSARCARRA